MAIAWPTVLHPHTTGDAFINGAKIRVTFDTGAGTSLLSTKAAARAGVTPDSPGVVEAGYGTGLGRASIKTYIGPFSSFKIGDEEIKNARLRFAALDDLDTDMLIGTDFFLSHRIYVASSQRQVVLHVQRRAGVQSGCAGPIEDGRQPPAAESAEGGLGGEPADAPGYSRRGAAFAARRDFDMRWPI